MSVTQLLISYLVFGCIFIVFLLISMDALAQWDPDAGVIPSYTEENTTIVTSSGGNGNEVLDNDRQSAWQSEATLPSGFIARPDANILHGLAATAACSSTSAANCANATDANLNSSITIPETIGVAGFEVTLAPVSTVHSVSLKGSANAAIDIYVITTDGIQHLIGQYTSADNYQLKNFIAELPASHKIKLSSTADFTIFEVAALAASPTEFVVVDLGSQKEIGWINTRHWAGNGNATATKVFVSSDNNNWIQVGELDPEALHPIITRVEPAIMARYVKVEHTLVSLAWKKVFMWEIDVYDRFGPYGEMPTAQMSAKTLGDIIGINGIWGWGYSTYSDVLAEGQGPTHFNRFNTHARNYHEINWDITDPDITPDFSNMAENGTQALWWLDWDREYGAWNDAGLKVQATVQFFNATDPMETWDDPFQAGYNYGYAFAEHFGPTHGNNLVDAMEVGNEPWDYPASFYLEVLHGMASGAKAADPNFTVLPCALQSGEPEAEHADGGNYLGAKVTAQEAQYLDALNSHYYSYTYREDGVRIAVHPEHLESNMRGILNDIKFRNHNMPGKPIYVSEWGWDSDGQGEDCTHGECVSEQAQALYAVRGALMYMRLGIERLTWFFYANVDAGSSLYTRAGVTGSVNTGFAEKQSFYSFEAMVNHLGDKHFLEVLQEDDDAWVYVFGNADGTPTHLAAWKPVALEEDIMTNVTVSLNYEADSTWAIQGLSATGQLISNPSYSVGTLNIPVSATPKIIRLKPANTPNPSTPTIATIKVVLEGAYDATTGLMTNELRTSELLPLIQPFARPPWNYQGVESVATVQDIPDNTVDWVLVEVRNPNDNHQIIQQRAALLLRDGSVIDVDWVANPEGASGVRFYDLPAGNAYYLSVKTRHHLAIMSNNPIELPNVTVFDCTNTSHVFGGSSQLTNLADGTYGLHCGDFNSDGVITVIDANYYTTQSAQINLYLDGDGNMDRAVTVADFNLFQVNASVVGVSQIRY